MAREIILTIEACTTYTLTNSIGKCNITFTIPSETASGLYQVVLDIEVAKSGGDIQKSKKTFDTMMVNVLSPFSLFPISSSITVAQGLSEQISINIYRQTGYTESITLTLEDLPQGVTYSYDPNPAPENHSLLTITADESAVPGSYDLTIKGSEGNNEATDQLTLIIEEPFGLNLTPSSISIKQGETDSVMIGVDRIFGYSETVILSAEANIIGQGSNFVDTTFNPNPVTWNDDPSQLTLTVGQSVPLGNYMLEIKGAVGTLIKSTNLELSVVP